MLKEMCLVVALLFVVFSSAGCQTVKGIGDDVKWLGEKTAATAESLE